MVQILRTSRWLRGVSLGVLLAAPLSHGQAASSPSSQANFQTVTDVLHRMSDRADVIFMGQVLAVRPEIDSENPGVVEVDFRVDQAIRGCTGTTYTLREWGGLWAGGNRRYRVGQRLLMLLHAPSAGGMSSPVDGLDGAIPIRQGSTATPLSASSASPASPFVDLRWLGTKLQRAVSYRTGPAPTADPVRQAATAPQRNAEAAVSGARSSVAPIIVQVGGSNPSEASVPAHEASVGAILDMFTTWQKASHVAP
jgi:hypothetical protein